MRVLLFLLIALNDPNLESVEWIEPPTIYYFLCVVDDIMMLSFFIGTVVLAMVRGRVRARYRIPAEIATSEDTVCAFVCPCLVVAQMLRHTADYSVQPARCCTSHGLMRTAAAVAQGAMAGDTSSSTIV
jgi:hypothetical protein